MNSPVFPEVPMRWREIEPGLQVYECPESGGFWIPLQGYLDWKERHPQDAASPAEPRAAELLDDSKRPAMICPESGRLLLRYRVGQGLGFQLDRSPATGGVWLDRGEWEALRQRGLHRSLHLIFTAAYQRQVRSAGYNQTLTERFRDRIGPGDFPRVAEFAAWIANHPKRRDICCFLLDAAGQKGEPEDPGGPRAQPE